MSQNPVSAVVGIHDMPQYGSILQSLMPGQLMMLDFTATWCGPCKMIAPLVDQLSVQYPNVVFGKVDVDEMPELASHYQVNSMPTFKFVRNNQIVAEFSGANSNRLRSTLQQLLAPPPPPPITDNQFRAYVPGEPQFPEGDY